MYLESLSIFEIEDEQILGIDTLASSNWSRVNLASQSIALNSWIGKQKQRTEPTINN